MCILNQAVTSAPFCNPGLTINRAGISSGALLKQLVILERRHVQWFSVKLLPTPPNCRSERPATLGRLPGVNPKNRFGSVKARWGTHKINPLAKPIGHHRGLRLAPVHPNKTWHHTAAGARFSTKQGSTEAADREPSNLPKTVLPL